MRSDSYYTCEQIVEKQNNIAKKEDERSEKQEIKERKKINQTTKKMYKKAKDEARLPFRVNWSLNARIYAESLGFKICKTKFGFKLKNSTLCYLDGIR